MTEGKRLRIHHSYLDGPALALTIELDRDGKVVFTPSDDSTLASIAMKIVGIGASMNRSPYVVRPDEGAAYLDAVAAMLGRTSRWLVTLD